MPYHYQTTFIVAPDRSQEQLAALLSKLRELLQQLEAHVVHEEALGLRPLAYPIQGHTQGSYHQIELQAPAAAVARLEQHYRIQEPILRFLTVRLDKHGVAYYAKKRLDKQAGAASAAPGAPQEPAPSAAASS